MAPVISTYVVLPFNVIGNINYVKSHSIQTDIYNSFQTVIYWPRNKKRTVVQDFSKKDILHGGTDRQLCANIRVHHLPTGEASNSKTRN